MLSTSRIAGGQLPIVDEIPFKNTVHNSVSRFSADFCSFSSLDSTTKYLLTRAARVPRLMQLGRVEFDIGCLCKNLAHQWPQDIFEKAITVQGKKLAYHLGGDCGATEQLRQFVWERTRH